MQVQTESGLVPFSCELRCISSYLPSRLVFLFIYLFIFTSLAPGMQIRCSKSEAALTAQRPPPTAASVFYFSSLFACGTNSRAANSAATFRARQRGRCNHTPIESGLLSRVPFSPKNLSRRRKKKKEKAGGGGGVAGKMERGRSRGRK